jgi:hypothetical protein
MEDNKTILGTISGERIIYENENQKSFSTQQTQEQFQKGFKNENIRFFTIDSYLPDHRPREKYADKLKYLKQLLEKKRDDELKRQIQLIRDEYDIKLKPIEHGIKKLEAIIYLKDKCKMVILEDGKVK